MRLGGAVKAKARWAVAAGLVVALGGCDGGGVPPGDDGGTDAGAETNTSDIALARFDSAGALDTTFGEGGVVRLDLGDNVETVGDGAYSLAIDGDDRLVVFGAKRASSVRRDGDRVVARFTPDGQLDATFADGGVYTFDLSGLTDTARHGFVEPTGEILSAGYARQPTGAGAQAENGMVLVRLTEAGAPAQGFGYKGVVNSNPFVPESPETQAWGMAEAYVAALQGGKYVTCGYGRDETVTSGKVDVVAFRFHADGTLDSTFGNRGDGTFTFDLIGQDERGRNMLVLPDGRLFMVGSGTPVAGNLDALTLVATVDGQLDEFYGTQGYLLHDLGRSEEALFGVALSPDGLTVAAVGYGKQAGGDDDALVHLHSVAGNEAVLTQLVPLSADGHDRLWAVTYAPDGTLYGAGYVEVDGDQRMAVARFTSAGALDPAFGDGGVITLNVTVAGPEEVRGLVVQSDGKIVVAGTAAH